VLCCLLKFFHIIFADNAKELVHIETRRSQHSQERNEHAGNIVVHCDLDLWPFLTQNKWVSRTHGGTYLCQVCIGFRNIVWKNRQTDRYIEAADSHTHKIPSAWVTAAVRSVNVYNTIYTMIALCALFSSFSSHSPFCFHTLLACRRHILCGFTLRDSVQWNLGHYLSPMAFLDHSSVSRQDNNLSRLHGYCWTKLTDIGLIKTRSLIYSLC